MTFAYMARPYVRYVLPAALMEVVYLMTRRAPWRGEWLWTFDWVAGSSLLLGPLAAGIVAYETSRRRVFDQQMAYPQAKRRVASVAAPIIAACSPILAVFCVGGIIAAVLSGYYSPTDGFYPWAVFVGLLSLVVSGIAGALIGSALSPTLAAILAWAGLQLLTFFSATLGLPTVLRFGGSSGSLAGLEVSGMALLVNGLFYLVTAGALIFVQLLMRQPRHHQRLLLGSAVALPLCAVVATNMVGAVYRPAESPKVVCRSSADQRTSVCMLAGNTSRQDEWLVALGDAGSRAEAAGLKIRGRYYQSVGVPGPQDWGVLMVDPTYVNIDNPAQGAITRSMARPAYCPQYYDHSSRPGKALMVELFLNDALTATLFSPESVADVNFRNWYKKTSQGERISWMQNTYDQMAACDLEGLSLPPGLT